MIDIQLSELDLTLEVAEIGELGAILDEHSTLSLQGPLVFGVDAPVIEFGYLDLDLLGFPYHGLSAYQLAVQAGFVGSLDQWLESLRGPPGDLSPAGEDAVNRAESAATSASGDAAAAAGFRTEAYTYSGYAGVHAQSANEAFTQAVAARDATGQIAQAMTVIQQESEAMLIGTREIATATIQQRVLAETARANAEAAEVRTARSLTDARSASAEAAEQATLAVNARNEANDRAEAAILAESQVQAYADDVRNDAFAANQSKVIATAARDAAQVTAQGVVISVEQAEAHATDAEAAANASRDERIAAQAARGGAETAAAASLTHSQSAEAHSNTAGQRASAADTQRIAAETAAGLAEARRAAAAQSATDANGSRVAAQTAEGLAAGHRTAAGNSAAAALQTKGEVEVLADAAGAIQSALSSRVDTVSARIDDAEGEIEEFAQVAITARDKVNATTGVNLNVNGFITGWRASNDGTTGVFTILGNVFRLVDPNGGTPITPFEVIGSMVYFNANVRINGNLLVTGTVTTPAVAPEAITGHVAAYNNNSVELTHNIAKRVHGLYIDVKVATSPIKIDFNFWASFVHDAGGSFIAYVQLVRSRTDTGGQVLITVPIYGSGMANDIWQGPVPIRYLDKPNETGLWHYYVQIYTNVNNMTKQSVTSRYGELTELKNNPASSITEGTGSGAGTGTSGGTGGGGGGSGGGGGGVITDPDNPGGGGGGGGGIEQPTIPQA